jgi:EAL domain-containing protein (putative c-di-GMP-specific phosphodiesterase class I)/GGDEF domain-containing protein
MSKRAKNAQAKPGIVEERVQAALEQVGWKGRECALFYVDWDGEAKAATEPAFLLAEVERSLRRIVAERCLVCAIDKAQVCFFVENMNESEARRLAERLCLELESTGLVEEGASRLSPRIGVGLLSKTASWPKSPEQLLAWAREACATASAGENGRVGIHRAQDFPADDVQWAKRLRRAVEGDGFFLLFQPAVSMTDGAATHYEVLLRLRDERGGVRYPGEFLPVAERLGFMGAIDRWVLNKAAEFLGQIRSAQPEIALNVNLSPRTFADRELPEFLRAKLDAAGAASEALIFDIAETESMLECRARRQTVETLAGMGCRFALDDFGACAGALNYLRLFPVDYVKFDGKAIGRQIHDETERVLIESMIDVVHRLGKLSVASFVEDETILRLQRSLGINYVQGYRLGKPEPDLLPPGANPLENFSTLVT